MVETQTVVELCSFEKETILPQLKCTASSAPKVESLGQPFHSLWPHPAELSPTGGIRVLQRARIFRVHFPGRLLSRTQIGRRWVVWLHCQGPLLSPL